MSSRSAIHAVSVALVCGGLGCLLTASAIGPRATYSDIFIVVGLDALTIGAAVQILLRIFSGEYLAVRTVVPAAPPRSLDKPEARELKIMLVQHLSHEKPVLIAFPPEDNEAKSFAQQLATFLDLKGFRIAGFGAESPPVAFAPGVGVDGNRIMVGPTTAATPSVNSRPFSCQPASRSSGKRAFDSDSEGTKVENAPAVPSNSL
jgi:hypothetical protein